MAGLSVRRAHRSFGGRLVSGWAAARSIVGVLLIGGALGALSIEHPADAAALVLAAAALYALFLAPMGPLIGLYVFATTAIPRSGTTIHHFPTTIPIVLLVFMSGQLLIRVLTGRSTPLPITLRWSLAVLWSMGAIYLMSAIMLHVPVLDYGPEFAAYIASSLSAAIVYLGIATGMVKWESIVRAVTYGMLAACAFAVVQRLMGLNHTMIPGVTISMAEAKAGVYNLKNNLTVIGDKMPSTYQNGNVFGGAIVLFFPLMLAYVASLPARGSRLLRLLVYVLPPIALLLSLSRTAWAGFAVETAILLVVALPGTKWRLILMSAAGAGLSARSIRHLSARVLEGSHTWAGRLPQYAIAWHSYMALPAVALIRAATIGFGFGSGPVNVANNMVIVSYESSIGNIMLCLGMVGMCAYVLPIVHCAWVALKWRDRTLAVAAAGLVGTMAVWFLDSQALLPPTAFNFWLLVGLLVWYAGRIGRVAADR